MKFFLAMLLLICVHTTCADSLNSLVLTDAEMQKLKKYFPSDDTNHLTWTGDPLKIKLPLNQEKRLIFQDKFIVDLKGALTTDQLRIINNDKSLYLTALQTFSETRIYVTLKESGEVVLIDLSIDEHASSEPHYIDVKHHAIKRSSLNHCAPIDLSYNENVSYVDLIRFAWKQVYAPESLLQEDKQFSRAPMHTQQFVSDLVYGDKVIASPTSSWSTGEFYVTAVVLRNKYPHVTQIDLQKDLCGTWQAALLYPSTTLQSLGNKAHDSGTLFLVSKLPFGEALGVCHGHA